MKTTLIIAISLILATPVMAKDNGPCNPGNAVFCGVEGPKGDTGHKGDTGATGPQGPKGDKGEKGDASLITLAKPATINMLQTRTPTGGQFTIAGGINFDEDHITSVTAGVRYGMTDCTDLVGAIDVDRHENINGYFGFTVALNKCGNSAPTPITNYHAPYKTTLK